MAVTLTINGVAKVEADRAAGRFRCDTLGWELESGYTVAFSEYGGRMVPQFAPESTVSLAIGGVTYFTGSIVSSHRTFAGTGWTHAYQCKGLEWRADQIPYTAGDGTGSSTWNRKQDDPDYNGSLAGKTIGDILKAVFDLHASALTGQGIGTYTLAELTALSIVPPDPVTIGGARLWTTLRQFVQEWARNHSLWILPDGSIHLLDSRAFSGLTLTLETDLIDPPGWSRSTEDCATRVVIRGAANVQPAYCSLKDGTLTEGFTAGDKTAWNWAKFAKPANSAASGTSTVLTSTTVQVTSSDASRTWAINYWSGIQGHAYLINTAATGVDMFEERTITSNTALTAGGTSVLTLDRPLAYATYGKFRIQALAGVDNKVWRKYNLPANLNGRIVPRSAIPYPFSNSAGSVTLTNYPLYTLAWSSSGTDANPYTWIWPAQLDIANNCIWFIQPTVKSFGNQADLDTGGFTAHTATNGVPDDVQAFLFYSTGALTATAPASSYEGTAFTADAISRTRYIDVPSWTYAGDLTNMTALAQMYLDSMKDTLYEGSVAYHGTLTSALVPGKALSVAAPGGASWASGMASMAAPIRGVTLNFTPEGDGPMTELHYSTRRQPATGDRMYIPPAFLAYQGGHPS
jgi:hypothetical protein